MIGAGFVALGALFRRRVLEHELGASFVTLSAFALPRVLRRRLNLVAARAARLGHVVTARASDLHVALDVGRAAETRLVGRLGDSREGDSGDDDRNRNSGDQPNRSFAADRC